VIDAVVLMECVLRTYIVLARIAALDRMSSMPMRRWPRPKRGLPTGDRLWSPCCWSGWLHLFEGRLSEASACVVRMERLAAANATPAASQIHRDRLRAELALAQSRWTEACESWKVTRRRPIRNRRLAMQVGLALA
jgi:hypothetical protein